MGDAVQHRMMCRADEEDIDRRSYRFTGVVGVSGYHLVDRIHEAAGFAQDIGLSEQLPVLEFVVDRLAADAGSLSDFPHAHPVPRHVCQQRADGVQDASPHRV